MGEVAVLALSFPSVVYTVLLGVVLVYWAFVMVGAIDLGEGSDGALDGLDLDGAAKGALEGAAKGIAEAAAGGHHGDIDFDGGHGDAGDAAGGDGHEAGALAAIVSALRLRKVPATVALSLIVTFSWLVCVVAMQALTRSSWAPHGSLVQWAILFASPAMALPLAALVIRPLSTVFVHRSAPSRADLVGKTCVVRTGKVNDAFGEGTLADGGAGLVVRVRIDGARELKRGEQALIVDFDPARDAFIVEPVDALLTERKE